MLKFPPLAGWTYLFLGVLGFGPGAAVTHADFEPTSGAWSGLSELLAVARGQDLDLQAPQEMDLSRLRSSDGLLLIHPQRPLPAADLVAFMREGGRLALVDDFGTGEELLEVFRIVRHAPGADDDSVRLRDNDNVLIAAPRADHPLASDVMALVVNHPQALHHDSLAPIFSLAEERDSVVLAGAVGRGRLVAIGDSSVLINNMLEFRGNRRFASNLVRYLAPGGRLYVVAGETPLTGAYGGAPSGVSALSKELAELSARPLPPRTVLLLTLGMVGVLLFMATTSLPQRSTYLRAVTLRAPQVVAGFAGRVDFFVQKGRNLLSPLMSYRLQLESELLARLGLPAAAPLADITAALRRAGLSPRQVEEARALLQELDALRAAQERPAAPPVVSRRRFRAMIARGDRILSAIHAG